MEEKLDNSEKLEAVVVIGAGLIGTSIALGLKRAGVSVQLKDLDSRAEKLANDLLSSDSQNGLSIAEPDLVVIAAPTGSLLTILERFETIYPNSIFIDIGSTKTKVEVDVSKKSDLAKRFCPTHPMAGRELDGAEAAQSDLFTGRSWIITPLAETTLTSIAKTKALIELLGAKVISMTPEAHDQAVAAVSHLPQVISSVLAAQYAGFQGERKEYLALAGSGVMDTTRIAGSNPKLWLEILQLNRNSILPLLKDFQRDLSTLIDNFDAASIEHFLEAGRLGRHALPGKHRSTNRNYTYLPVVLEDKPNQLAALFNECAKANVNVEDINIEHSPEQETGLVLLALSAENATLLQKHLAASGWRVHPPRTEN